MNERTYWWEWVEEAKTKIKNKTYRFISKTDSHDRVDIYESTQDHCISTKKGNDWIQSGSGNDLIDAGSGADTVYGNGGNDVIMGYSSVASESSTFFGGSGKDFLFGGHYSLSSCKFTVGRGTYNLNGGLGEDTIFTGGYYCNAHGGAGNDKDIFYVHAQFNTLDGGQGNDYFVFSNQGTYQAVTATIRDNYGDNIVQFDTDKVAFNYDYPGFDIRLSAGRNTVHFQEGQVKWVLTKTSAYIWNEDKSKFVLYG